MICGTEVVAQILCKLRIGQTRDVILVAHKPHMRIPRQQHLTQRGLQDLFIQVFYIAVGPKTEQETINFVKVYQGYSWCYWVSNKDWY